MKLGDGRLPAQLLGGDGQGHRRVAIEAGRWEIYVGGAAGAHVRKGDLWRPSTARKRSSR
jgi:hypothetical protein